MGDIATALQLKKVAKCPHQWLRRRGAHARPAWRRAAPAARRWFCCPASWAPPGAPSPFRCAGGLRAGGMWWSDGPHGLATETATGVVNGGVSTTGESDVTNAVDVCGPSCRSFECTKAALLTIWGRGIYRLRQRDWKRGTNLNMKLKGETATSTAPHDFKAVSATSTVAIVSNYKQNVSSIPQPCWIAAFAPAVPSPGAAERSPAV
jgi:hypothetical protein